MGAGVRDSAAGIDPAAGALGRELEDRDSCSWRSAIAVLLVLFSIGRRSPATLMVPAVRLANLLLVVLAPPSVVLGVVRSLRANSGVTIEAVLGVICLYLLAGMAFALIYGAVGNLSGGFFANGVAATEREVSVLQLHNPDHGRLRRPDGGVEPWPHAVGDGGADGADLPGDDSFGARQQPAACVARGLTNEPMPRHRICACGAASR